MTTLLTKPMAGASPGAPGRGLTPAEREIYERIPDEIDYVPHRSFASPKAERELFGGGTEIDIPAWIDFTDQPDGTLRRGRKRAVLSRADEAKLFLRYNYARCRLAALLKQQRRRDSAARARDMIRWFRRALEARANLVRANLALVVTMAKRVRIPTVDFGELISEGNLALLRSVEKFDASRGYKFSTYACKAILKAFSRLARRTRRYRQHFPVEFDPDLERSDWDVRMHEMQRARAVSDVRDVLIRNRAGLSGLEQTIVLERFAIQSGGKGRTLSDVGKMVGLTNERVRQIQNAALRKLRQALAEAAPAR